jgi:ethanolamine ammonia-lyase small subunit
MSSKVNVNIGRPDPWKFLGRFTTARIALGRAGGSLPTAPLLEFQLAHARARDAVHCELDVASLAKRLREQSWETVELQSAAKDRHSFIQRPDLGRILSAESPSLLEALCPTAQPFDVVFVLADGLSALALERHSIPLLREIYPYLTEASWRIAPLCLVTQGRVAIGDEIGALLSARIAVMLIGERPGLSSPDSLGIYLTYNPLPGRSNAERNCISNVRPEGLSYALAAHKLRYLMTESRARKLSGVRLKEDAGASLTAKIDPTLP